MTELISPIVYWANQNCPPRNHLLLLERIWRLRQTTANKYHALRSSDVDNFPAKTSKIVRKIVIPRPFWTISTSFSEVPGAKFSDLQELYSPHGCTFRDPMRLLIVQHALQVTWSIPVEQFFPGGLWVNKPPVVQDFAWVGCGPFLRTSVLTPIDTSIKS